MKKTSNSKMFIMNKVITLYDVFYYTTLNAMAGPH